MLRIPIEHIHEDDISLGNQFIVLNIRGQSYKIPEWQIPYYHTEISQIKNEKERIKIIHYFLTNASSGLKSFIFKDNTSYRKIAPILRKVEVKHDPSPDLSLHLFPYESLESVQWHLMCHGLADYWLNPAQPCLTSGFIPERNLESVWDNFVDQVKCKRWGIEGFPRKEYHWCKEEWQERRHELDERLRFSSDVRGSYGCRDCINEQGAKKFITCCNFFEKYRIKYLENLREWIICTIQDAVLMPWYAKDRTALPEGKVSLRKHLHVTDKGAGILYAYVIDREKDGKINVYLIIFRLLAEKHAGVKGYVLKTVYGITSTDSREEAETFINERVKRNWKGLEYEDFCHASNWDAIR